LWNEKGFEMTANTHILADHKSTTIEALDSPGLSRKNDGSQCPSGYLLVVDDNESIRKLLCLHLERKGYRLVSAVEGRQALELVGQDNFDLVLLDIDMPGMSGLEVLKMIRQRYSSAELPVVMVTATTRSEEIVGALNLGASDYLTKPIDFPVALARINTLMSHKRAEESLRESEERYALAVKGANEGLWDWNLRTNQLYYSPRWKSMLGCEESEIKASPNEWFSRIHPEDRARVAEDMSAHHAGRTPHFQNEHRMLHKDGTYRWMLARGIAVRDDRGRAYRMAGSQTDITEGKVADALTGLPNRILFMDRLGRAVERGKYRKGYLFAVFFLDLDRFKVVNDSLGHLIGDELLVATARRLQACLHTGDTIARLGGDEFTILLDDIQGISDATRIVERIQRQLALPFNINGHEVFTGASIGIALSSTGYERPEDVLRDADTAMYRAKALGKARYEVFDPAMRERAVERLQLETDLRRALERKEFRVYYQIIVSLNDGHINGCEALLRWQHPTRGLMHPSEFIPVAEETGLIVPIGHWVILEACRQLHVWQQRFRSGAPLTMSVNFSSKQFMQPELVEQMKQILSVTCLEAHSLKLEITESLIMENPEAARALLLQLKALDIELGIDDFGTGYSSLSYLHRFPIDRLKIDRSFIERMGLERENVEIVRTIITLAHNLGVDVIAEGVETTEQLTLLQKLKCKYGQGFLFSPPVDGKTAEGLIARKPCWSNQDRPKSRTQPFSTISNTAQVTQKPTAPFNCDLPCGSVANRLIF
jgi:diguanylate cyclase (GGDEF)-like protein/PAS domain S-box-containing protein